MQKRFTCYPYKSRQTVLVGEELANICPIDLGQLEISPGIHEKTYTCCQ